jgi:hypothetical protein
MRHVVAVLVLVLGIAGVLAGGYDDSPGLQLIGLLLIVGAAVLGVRAARHRTRPAQK